MNRETIDADQLRNLAEEARRRAGLEPQPTTRTSAEPTASSALAEILPGSRTARCETCGADYVRIRTPSGRYTPCPKCYPPAAVEAPAPAREARAYTGDILEDLRRAGVNVHKYQDATLDAFDPTPDGHALDRVWRWIEAWRTTAGKRYPARDWMYFYGAGSSRNGRDVEIGATGNGKTFLAIAAARYLIEAGLLAPDRFRFATAETILLESEATFRSGSEDSEMQLLARYERPDLLVIDDIGVRVDWSPHAIRIFDELTKRREAKATIWTSNLSIAVLAGAAPFMRRIVDRIAGECGDGAMYVIEFRGPSRRRQRSMRQEAA